MARRGHAHNRHCHNVYCEDLERGAVAVYKLCLTPAVADGIVKIISYRYRHFLFFVVT